MFGAELLLDLGADRWVLYSFKELCDTSVGNPGRQARSQRRSPCNVGIHVGRHILSGIARGLNHSNDLRHCAPDRKSTRLNSSHRCISYAVFCLKKKTLPDQARPYLFAFLILYLESSCFIRVHMPLLAVMDVSAALVPPGLVKQSDLVSARTFQD